MKTTLFIAVAAFLLACRGASAQAPGEHVVHSPTQTQAQSQNQSQAQNATATSSSAGQQNTTSFESRVPRQSPPAIAPDIFPSAPCRVSFGGAGSAPIGGLSAGFSKLDDECDKRETARAFAQLGYRTAALKILCTTKAAKKSLGERCAEMRPNREWQEQRLPSDLK